MTDTPSHQPRRAFDKLWDFDHPERTETAFRKLLTERGETLTPEERLEILTQIARCLGLQRKFDDAHALLNDVESVLTDDTPIAHMRYLLERGRVFNSSGDKDGANGLFMQAWEQGSRGQLDGYAVDAGHMLGIIEPGGAGHEWNLKSLKLAEASSDPAARRWRGSLLNNIGWYEHGEGRFSIALEYFEQALAHRREEGDAGEIRVAQWCVGRCLRSLDRLDEALVVQLDLERAMTEADQPDGYVYEELAECLLALGRREDARPHFRHAFDLLSKDTWLAESEKKRLERLKSLGSQDVDSK